MTEDTPGIPFQTETRGFDMSPVLPPCSAINYVAMQSWKELHMPSTSAVRPAPHNLNMLSGMHIEILYEVLAHLHPIDLIHVSRTSTNFRAVLLALALAPLWRAAFEGRSPFPAYSLLNYQSVQVKHVRPNCNGSRKIEHWGKKEGKLT
ncbi:hypothetical protein B0H13DRAFT_2344409 [Mycena leptocephala]|nr:hypothetical protein B0H13DRAFT_2344409 [Mycena leptocephala]